MSASLISIVGPPAAGKTTLARCLARALPARLILEDYRGNPFLHQAYVSGGDINLPCQLYFLMSRAGQLAGSTWPSRGLAVSDYDFCQDRIYAHRRLGREDFHLYEQIARRVTPHLRRADVTLHLDASLEALTRRIHRRGRSYEEAMSPDFLQELREAYFEPELLKEAGHLLRVDTEETDIRRGDALEELVKQIRSALTRTP